MARPVGITVLGATGSIGVSTLDVLARHPGRYRVVALTARRAVDRLFEQCLAVRPRFAVMVDAAAARELRARARDVLPEMEVLAGVQALESVASLDEVDYVMAAIVGGAGLRPTLAAARAGKRVLLANKESLVMSGELFMRAVREGGAELLPIDSEHNAVFQCMPANLGEGLERAGVRRILLTASGGPFRTLPLSELSTVTPEQACAHPNWVMGRKISVDSATMMNKGLEVMEACWLFNATPQQVQVVIHPQSVIHSMVEFHDSSVLAQLGNPDMRTPIAHALAWPRRMVSGVPSLDFAALGGLTFEPVDLQRFPCLDLAYQAMRAGGTCPAVLNAANEVAVQAFLDRRLPYTGIPQVVEATMGKLAVRQADSIDDILEADSEARGYAGTRVDAMAQAGLCR